MLLEIRNLLLQTDHVRVLAREFGLQLRKVALQLVKLFQPLEHLRRRIGILGARDVGRVLEAFRQLLALLDEAQLLLAVEPQLRVHPFQRREVDADLLRELAGVLRRELRDGGILPIQRALGLGELLPQELQRAQGRLRSHRLVLLDVERRNRVGHIRRGLRRITHVLQRERHRLHLAAHLLGARRVDLDVRAHLVQRIVSVGGAHQLRIQVEAPDQFERAIAAEDLLLDDVQAAFELARRAVGGADDVLVDWPLDEDERLPLIDVRQVDRESDGRGEHRGEGAHREQAAPPEDVENPDGQRIVSG